MEQIYGGNRYYHYDDWYTNASHYLPAGHGKSKHHRWEQQKTEEEVQDSKPAIPVRRSFFEHQKPFLHQIICLTQTFVFYLIFIPTCCHSKLKLKPYLAVCFPSAHAIRMGKRVAGMGYQSRIPRRLKKK